MNLFLCGLLSFLLCFLFTHCWLLISEKRSFYQNIRPEGPKEHLEKKGRVPTMGGIAILLAVLFGTAAVWNKDLWVDLGAFLACGFLGFTDDLMKFYRGNNLGLKARHKFAGQILIGVGLWFALKQSGQSAFFSLPFFGNLDVGLYFLPLVVFVLVATTNAVNLTDGLDGLASGTAAIVFFFFMAATLFVPTTGCFCAAIIGACLAFLWFNGYPAKVFMGDVGSLALGGALCAIAFQTRLVFWLPIAGAVFVAETLSVILQVAYFKLTRGKRIFKMSPLHHHLELSGVPETQVTLRFWIVTFFLVWFCVIWRVNGF